MPTYTVTHRRRADNVCAVQTLEPPVRCDVGDTVVVANVHANFDGTYTVLSREPFYLIGKDDQGYLQFDYDDPRENQIIYASNGDDVEYEAASGTVTLTETCTWIVNQDVLDWLGIAAATANDTAFVTVCTGAANAVAYRRRQAAGYRDSLTVVPGTDVKLGTTMFAAGLYRARGAAGYDSFASYETMAAGQPNLAMGEILRLWGCNRPQVA